MSNLPQKILGLEIDLSIDVKEGVVVYSGPEVINSPDDLVDRQVKTHWHFQKKRYSISVRASNGRWYVVKDQNAEQLFFGKLVLSNATFTVQPAGKKKAYKTGKRNLHASVIGTVKRAEFKRTAAFVPCGSLVLYSHNLYPEPEFKYVPAGYEEHMRSLHISALPGIEWAEMLACGSEEGMFKTDTGWRAAVRPNMLAGGIIRYNRGF
jgi:hypothetical protein